MFPALVAAFENQRFSVSVPLFIVASPVFLAVAWVTLLIMAPICLISFYKYCMDGTLEKAVKDRLRK